MRSAPQSRLFFAMSLINAMVSTFTFGFFEVAFDLCFQKRRASLTVPPQKGRLLGRSRALASRTASLLPEAPGGFDPSWCTLAHEMRNELLKSSKQA